jgi:hypothetical protein
MVVCPYGRERRGGQAWVEIEFPTPRRLPCEEIPEIEAAVSDYGEPAASRTSVGAAAPREIEPVAALRRSQPTAHAGQDRKAA